MLDSRKSRQAVEKAEEEAKAFAAKNEHMRDWPCPHCGQKYGPNTDLRPMSMGSNVSLFLEAERPYVMLFCSTCNYCNLYNEAGSVLAKSRWDDACDDPDEPLEGS